MGEIRDWGQLADQRASEIRQEFYERRIRVRPEPLQRDHYSQVGNSHWVPKDWYRQLKYVGQSVARGAAASAEARKTVLLGRWAASQMGMWTLPVESGEVLCGLRSGNVPSKSNRPYFTKFHAMEIADEDVIELDGVRITHPLRTFVDLCRLGDVVSAHMAMSWLLDAGISAYEVQTYVEEFDQKIRPKALRQANAIANGAVTFRSYENSLAWGLLRNAGMPVEAHASLEDFDYAPILVGGDLIIAVEKDPLFHDVKAAGVSASEVQRLRKKTRWLAARGYRTLYFALEELEKNPDAFISDVYSAKYLRNRDLRF